jgi:hypothetical protein
MISLRVGHSMLAEIDRLAAAAGMSRSMWMIEAALNYQQPDDTDDLDDIRKRLGRLEQLAGI